MFVISLQFQAQITYVNVNPDCSSSIITGQNATGLCPISLPGGNSAVFRWDSFSPMEWFFHIEGASTNVNIAISTSSGTNPYGKPYAAVFASGNAIGNTATYSSGANNDPLISDNSRANFSGQGDRYVGFRFVNGGQTFYGWILVNSTGQGLTVKEYAYQGTANTAINAGDKGTLSIEEFDAKYAVSVFPNPANNILYIKTEEVVRDVKIFSLSGALLKIENNLAANFVDISQLQKGYYFVKIDDKKVVPFIKE